MANAIFANRRRLMFLRPLPPVINRAHPLFRLLTSYIIPLYPGTLVDITKVRPKGTGTAGDVGLFGQRVGIGGTWTMGAASDTSDLNWTSGGFTVATWSHSPGDNGAYVSPMDRSAYVSETNNQGWILQQRIPSDPSPGYNFMILNNNAIANYGFASSASFSGRAAGDVMMAGSSDGSSSKSIYVGFASPSPANFTKTTSTTGNMAPISQTGNALNGGVCAAYVLATWSRQLSDAEILSFYYDPFGLLIYPDDPVWALNALQQILHAQIVL